jgi:hypothetical protein
VTDENRLHMTDPFSWQQGMTPNTRPSKVCVAWMYGYFRKAGDFNPSNHEIHLDVAEKSEIYKLFRVDASYRWLLEDNEIIGYTTFTRLWDKVFPFVKLRVYKAVPGKCSFCAKLTELRSKTQNREQWKYITYLYALHRVSYMNERKSYYEKQLLAIEYPDKYMSIIFDGMSKHHSQLPYMANMKQLNNPLQTHLLGGLEHGQKFVSLVVIPL